jgi:hypothetical protein
MAEKSLRWGGVVASFADDAEVFVGAGRGFGAGALKAKGKIFAFVSAKGDFVVKLPKARADQLFAAREANPFDPGHGRPMKQWAAIVGADADWCALAREARIFVGGV